jgi:hypothetical protein
MPKLTPTKVDKAGMDAYVTNIKDRVGSADPSQIARSLVWYDVANDLARFIGNGDVRLGAGLLAALSINKQWAENKRLAADAANGNVHGHMEIALSMARDILAGKDPITVLPADSKTWNFYRAILDPNDPDTVVVDRHVHDAIVGETFGTINRGLSNKTRYATMAHAVRTATFELNQGKWHGKLTPNIVQALLWITQIDMVRGTRTRAKNQGALCGFRKMAKRSGPRPRG